MARLLFTTLSALLCIALVGSPTIDAATQSYVLQRRIGAAGEWEPITTFVVSRHSPDAPAKVKQAPPKDVELSKDKKNALAAAQFVHYRVAREDDADGRDAVGLALSPCSILRGFEAVDARAVVVREEVRVAVGPGTSVTGLQARSETNTFHAKMLNGDECDRSILSLFPHVRVRAGVGYVEPIAPRSVPNYAELDVFARRNDPKVSRSGGRKKKASGGGNSPQEHQTQVEGEEEEEEVDSRTFFQKYWMYLVLPFVFSFIQNMIVKN
ncbi:hypothetical protein DQ04_00081170 [Trypanosoma grayi]|uniref:hypothetical protein n=1 Tax=Trypanosoma grayi TaxID=71804 RepID=UPI0004F4586D|nr:hypothetical protein DQ04_00081170 [Trypanosoma grayi]KEG15418.1 hypothetical protein DQ04_00081170 [Trypanosoma grayi]